MLRVERVDVRAIQDVRDMIMGAKKRTCGLCDDTYSVSKLYRHAAFDGMDICNSCLLALHEIEQYGIKEEDEFIRLEEYVGYKLKDEGMMCPGSWYARSVELKEEAVIMEDIYTD